MASKLQLKTRSSTNRVPTTFHGLKVTVMIDDRPIEAPIHGDKEAPLTVFLIVLRSQSRTNHYIEERKRCKCPKQVIYLVHKQNYLQQSSCNTRMYGVLFYKDLAHFGSSISWSFVLRF